MKKDQAYQNTRLAITEALLQYEKWSPVTVESRQSELWKLAQQVWPADLV